MHIRAEILRIERSVATPAPDYALDFAGACTRLLHGADGAARSALERFRLPFVDQSTANSSLLAHLIAEALLQRFDHSLVSNANVYMQYLDMPQTTLFYLMAQAVPLVDASHRIANRFLIDGLGDAPRATLLDLGVGRGRQLELLLQTLAQQRPTLEQLSVVAVDPVADNLTTTSRVVRGLAAALPFTIDYRPVNRLIENDLIAALPAPDDRALLINSAFTLHHTRHALGDTAARTNLLRQFQQLRPAAFALCEPSANHDSEDVLERLHSAWRHFGQLFDLVDTAKLAARQRFAIKAHFFGREIRDLFAIEDEARCERHEPWQAWQARLAAAGFCPLSLVVDQVTLPSECTMHATAGCVRLGFRGVDLVAVFGASNGD